MDCSQTHDPAVGAKGQSPVPCSWGEGQPKGGASKAAPQQPGIGNGAGPRSSPPVQPGGTLRWAPGQET
jgi:hypothetical protein